MPSGQVLCEYKAGKLVLKRDEQTGKHMMHADKRKGLIRVKREDSDGLVHFQWLKRIAGVMGAPSRSNLVDDLILFPQEAVMKKSHQGGTDSRVHLLKFQQGDRKLYFWFQEDPSEDGDENFVKKVNLSLNGRTSEPTKDEDKGSGSGAEEKKDGDGSGGGDGKATPSGGDRKEQQGGDNKDGGEGNGGDDGAATPMDTATQGDGAGGADASAAEVEEETGAAELTTHPLADFGGGVSQEALAAALLSAASSVGGQFPAAVQGPSLSDVLKPETIVPLLRNKEIQERLAEYLPEEHRHESAVLELASSPQFQQQLETFSQALQSGQLNLNAFGIPHDALTVADFLRSIETMSAQESANHGGGEGDKSNDAK